MDLNKVSPEYIYTQFFSELNLQICYTGIPYMVMTLKVNFQPRSVQTRTISLCFSLGHGHRFGQLSFFIGLELDHSAEISPS